MKRFLRVSGYVFVMAFAFAFASATCAAEKHEVKPKDYEVKKNDAIDYKDCEETVAADVSAVAGGRILITSKTYVPPKGMSFLKFPGTETFVDLVPDLGALPPRARPDLATEIRVKGVYLVAAPGSFPLQAEGNLSTGEGTGGKLKHWSAAADVVRVDIEVNAKVGDATDDDSDDIVCRISTDPAGRPKLPCRARVRGLKEGKLTVVMTSSTVAGQLRFPEEKDTTITLELPADEKWIPFEISGQVESAKMNDALIEAHINTASGGICGQQDVTVLWVSAPEGNAEALEWRKNSDQTLAEGNVAREAYHRTADPKTYNLGIRTFNAFRPRMGWGMEWHGVVHPADFVVPARGRLGFDRDMECRFYHQDGRTPFVPWSRNFSQSIPPGNDTGPAGSQDQVPPDIYDWDNPGVPTGVQRQGFIWRIRANFIELASFSLPGGNPVRCSNNLAYWIRMSITQTRAPAGANWILTNDVQNDNRCEKGPPATGLEWNATK